MNKYLKLSILAAIDSAISISAFLATLFSYNYFTNFTFDAVNIKSEIFITVIPLVIFAFLNVIFNYFFKVYYVMWNYAGIHEYLKLMFSNFTSTLIMYIIMFAFKQIELSAVFVLFFFITLLSVVYRVILASIYKKKSLNINGNRCNIMVIGAGDAGALLVQDICNNQPDNTVRCIIDDDVLKHGKYIFGVKIIGGSDKIISAAKEYAIDTIVFAIPTCPSERKSAILNLCQKTDCKVRTIPSLHQLMSSDDVNVKEIRNVEIEDLLGRDPIDIKVNSVMAYVQNKTVMVTGGGGSIGSELCRQIAEHNPKTLIIFDIYENNAYEIQNELKRKHPNLDLITLIGSVRDIDRLESVFDKYKPNIVYHAAAHKHVPLMEDSPNESIKNNVFGTLNTATCADKYGVERFILISTDKAVNPTNIMGASKRICEMVIQSFNNRSKTEYVAVRFGNVLGSNGSVIPLFKKQIEQGGPVTVTDPNIIRYFMTIPEAVSLVLQAGASAKGGEIFVLDMGEPVRIIDLAENLIKLSGFKPYTEIPISFTGLRPGEKLYEEKLLSEEGLIRTSNRLIHIGKPIEFDENKFNETLDELKRVMADDKCDIRSLVKCIVPTYNYTSNI